MYQKNKINFSVESFLRRTVIVIRKNKIKFWELFCVLKYLYI